METKTTDSDLTMFSVLPAKLRIGYQAKQVNICQFVARHEEDYELGQKHI